MLDIKITATVAGRCKTEFNLSESGRKVNKVNIRYANVEGEIITVAYTIKKDVINCDINPKLNTVLNFNDISICDITDDSITACIKDPLNGYEIYAIICDGIVKYVDELDLVTDDSYLIIKMVQEAYNKQFK